MRNFDEFIGFDKEARVSEFALLAQARNDPEMQKLLDKAIAGDSEAAKAYNQKFHDFAIAQRMKDVEKSFDKKQKIKGPINNLKALRAFEKSNPELVANLVNGKISNDDYTNANRNFMMDWEKNRLDKKWRKRHLGKYASEEFDGMVKCAYDEICGFDKEARVEDWSDDKLKRKKMKLEKKTAGGYGKAVAKGALISAGLSAASLGVANGVVGRAAKAVGFEDPYKGIITPKYVAKGVTKISAEGAAGAALLHALRKRKLNKINNELEVRHPSSAEKEAAHYDEAQYAKEAGINDMAGKAWNAVKNTYSGANVRDAKKRRDWRNKTQDIWKASHGSEPMPDWITHTSDFRGQSVASARLQRGLAYGIPTAAVLGGAAVAGKKLYDRHKSKAEAEKTAAVNDEICGFEKEAFRLGGFDGPRLKVPESNLSSISSTLKNHGGKLSAAQEAKKLEKLKELESMYKGLTNENFKNLKSKSVDDELAELAKRFGRR